MHNPCREKVAPNFWANFVIFKEEFPTENKDPMGKSSPNLVTLAAAAEHSNISSNWGQRYVRSLLLANSPKMWRKKAIFYYICKAT
jgi:hypothetical protein